MAGIGMTPRGPVIAEDVRDLQSRTGHCRRLLDRLVLLLLRDQRRQPVEWAHDLTNDVGGHMRIACRRLQLRMSERTRVTLITFLRH